MPVLRPCQQLVSDRLDHGIDLLRRTFCMSATHRPLIMLPFLSASQICSTWFIAFSAVAVRGEVQGVYMVFTALAATVRPPLRGDHKSA